MREIGFEELDGADLIVDAVYEGGSTPHASIGDDPISKLLPGCGNMGGFRSSGRGMNKRFVVLYSSGEDRDWPDVLDLVTGRFIYYGDNKKPGHELHDTGPKGNSILRTTFDHLHVDPPQRKEIPPFFIFAKNPTDASRSVRFLGLAAPGSAGIPATEDLVAIWKTTANQRFQNYRAIFSVLDAPVISRAWLTSIAAGDPFTSDAPEAWLHWVNTGEYCNLTSEPTTVIRSINEQIPDTPAKTEVLATVFDHFRSAPFAFEEFAARLFQLSDQRVVVDEITRGVVDGGRDAIGRYRLGLEADPIWADFSLEAKCYQPPIGDQRANSVGVKEVSRLISRIRHRQFGVLVTTSVVGAQAYREVREDRHPIIFLCGKDIAETLIASGYNSRASVRSFLMSQFPVESK